LPERPAHHGDKAADSSSRAAPAIFFQAIST
jgi:hypothetical protein